MLEEMIVLRLIGFVIRLAFLPLTATWLWLRRRLPRNAWLQVDIEGSVTEFAPRRPALPFLPFFQGQRGIALSAFHELVDRVAEEKRVRGVVIVLRSLGAGMATATSLRKAIQRLRETGREKWATLLAEKHPTECLS